MSIKVRNLILLFIYANIGQLIFTIIIISKKYIQVEKYYKTQYQYKMYRKAAKSLKIDINDLKIKAKEEDCIIMDTKGIIFLF